ncbi:MAG: serine/threonine-protein kinase [Planctomycetota bacterium]
MNDPLDSTEDPVEALLADCLLRPVARRGAAVEEACEAHPALANELRSRWSALRAAGLDAMVPSTAAGDVPDRLGDFLILEPLGGGGMGIVYLAEQVSLGREVALKLMRPEGTYFPDAHERFRREVEAIARLEHPSIVKVHAYGEEEGVPYFAMERIDGRTLAEVLRVLADRSPTSLSGRDLARAVGGSEGALFGMSWTDACVEMARQVAAALAHAHGAGIVHRDVKPSNIALTRDGRVQLFDFGLAATSGVDRLTRTGGQLGTLHYMSPEQILGDRELDARSDIYALGVTLYELLALRSPFVDDTRSAVEARILQGRPAPLRTLNRRVSVELERVTAKAMELDRTRRYATAHELEDELRRVLERRPVQARPPGPLLRARRWAQRNPTLAVAILAGIALFVVAPSVLLWRERTYSADLGAALAKEKEALAAERLALRESRMAQTFAEGLLFASDPYSTNNEFETVSDLLRVGFAALPRLEGIADSPRMEARLSLGLAQACWSRAMFRESLQLAERALELERQLGEMVVVNDVHPLQVVVESLNGLNRIPEAARRVAEELASRDDLEPRYRGRLQYLLGTARFNLGDFDRAEPLLREALAVYPEDPPENREANLAIRWMLSGVLTRSGRPEEALELVEPTTDLAREMAGDDRHPAVAESLCRLAETLAALELIDEAIDAQVEATGMIDDFYGAASMSGIRFHGDLALLYGEAELYGDAIREALVTHRSSVEVFGEEDQRTRRAQQWVQFFRGKDEGE